MARDMVERVLAIQTDAIEFCSYAWGINGAEVYNLLKDTGVLQIIKECYDVLHTVGPNYLVEWVEEALECRGVDLNAIKKL